MANLVAAKTKRKEDAMFCKQCGNEIVDTAAICVKCGVATGNVPLPGSMSDKNRTSYILLGVFLGLLGIHNLYAGYNSKAVAQWED